MKSLSKTLSCILVLVSLLSLAGIVLFSPVCSKLLELANGNMTHMKCFYTGKASIILTIILLISSILGFLKENKYINIVIIVIGVLLIAVTYDSFIGIGICKKAMDCHSTALWIRGEGIISIIIGLIMLFKKPKLN